VPTRRKSSPRSKSTEHVSALEIQRAWKRENAAQHKQEPLGAGAGIAKPAVSESSDARSALKKRRSLRDLTRSGKRPKRGNVRLLKSPKLDSIPWLLHGFSTRQGGVSEAYGENQLNLGCTEEDSAKNVDRNRALFLSALGANTGKRKWPLVNLSQIHSSVIHRVRRGEDVPPKGDGLITDVPGIVLAVKVADCVPVIIADRRQKAVGIFHAGWRGTAARIVQKGVGELRHHLGSDPADIVAAIGPAIGRCCYEIGDQVESEFESQFAYWRELFEDVFDSWSLHTKYPLLFMNQRAPGHGEPALSRHLDLVEANCRQLLDAGLKPENIDRLNQCTSCHTDLFFSHRKERVTGRMMAAVGMR
jgi:YfiH family protein